MILGKLLDYLLMKNSTIDNHKSFVNYLGDSIGYLVIDEQGNEIIFADCGSIEENYRFLTKQQVMTSEVIKHEFIEHYWNGYIDYDKQGYIITIKGVDSP